MMALKDYYKILEVSPTATYAEIKKSYRRLALRFHPDKNFGNELYEAKFKEIQEAYQILSDGRQRQDYNTRRENELQAQTKKPAPQITPQTILNQTLDFRRKIAVLDPDRMNKLALYQQIQHLLSRNNIMLLKKYNDPRVNKRIIEEILFCSRYLPFPHVEKICFQLTALAGTDNALYHRIYTFSKEVRLRNYWNRYKVFAALIMGIILCLFIYLLSSSV